MGMSRSFVQFAVDFQAWALLCRCLDWMTGSCQALQACLGYSFMFLYGYVIPVVTVDLGHEHACCVCRFCESQEE